MVVDVFVLLLLQQYVRSLASKIRGVGYVRPIVPIKTLKRKV